MNGVLLGPTSYDLETSRVSAVTYHLIYLHQTDQVTFLHAVLSPFQELSLSVSHMRNSIICLIG